MAVFGFSCLFRLTSSKQASETEIRLVKIALLISLTVCEAKNKAVMIGLIGDSTVAMQSGWGPAFSERFDLRTKIVNYAKNGATLQASVTE